MGYRAAVATVALLASFGVWAEEGKFWSFHGLTLGASESAVTKEFSEFSCKPDGPIRRCEGFVKFDARPGILSTNGATNVFLVFLQDRLVNIDVVWMPAFFDASYLVLEKNYGSPLSDKKDLIKTSDGREFENRTLVWHNGTSTIRYDKYWRNIGISRILYMLKE
jgi:hypothetical protein